jgi:hypothetical protein
MLIPTYTVLDYLRKYNVQTTGALHIGAHECEELPFYRALGLTPSDILWVDALPHKVDEAMRRGIPNVYGAVVTDVDDSEVEFHISNNIQSSSVFEFGTHAYHHPHVSYIGAVRLKTITLDTFFKRIEKDPKHYTFWNLDIQGAELLALKGGSESLRHANALYLEVNSEEVYKGCAKINEIDDYLRTYGFERVHTHLTEYGWGDALYIKTRPSV